MATALPNVTVPTGSRLRQSFEYAVDVRTREATGSTGWLTLIGISDVTKTITPATEDGANYDHAGSSALTTIGQDFAAGLTVPVYATSSGALLPALQILRNATDVDALGLASLIQARLYHAPRVAGVPADPTEAYEGLASVTIARATTGPKGAEKWNLTLTGYGAWTKIANPLVTP